MMKSGSTKARQPGFLLAPALLFLLITGTPMVAAEKPSSYTVGPNDGKVAYITARLLEELQYSQQPFDRTVSEKFFDEYISTLDPRRENFLQSDIDSFDHYRTNLDVYTIGGRSEADLRPAYEIFDRFKQRLAQHAAYVDELLKQDKLKFDAPDRFVLDRRHAPWPRNMSEAQQLWRDRVRLEFLQEKLGRELSATNESIVLPLNRTNLTDIASQLQKHYRWTLHMVTNWDSENVLSTYLDAMVHAYDPHSDYLNGEHAQTFSIEMSLSLFGIGAQLSEQDGYCTIDSLVPGGPAEKSKQVHPKDKIIAVAQSNQPPVNVVDVDLPRVVGMIRGAKGTQVRLTIIPAEEPSVRREISLIREEIKLEDQKAKAKLLESVDDNGHTNRVGVISVPSFYATMPLGGNENHAVTNFISSDVETLVRKLMQAHAGGIVLDLRNDPGGSLEEAVKFTGLFIKDGPVVLARSTDKSVIVKSDFDTNVVYSGPLAVLVNRFSASASEIVAAALQDYGRAIVIGDTNTFGKGTVQQLTPLRLFLRATRPSETNDPGMLKITISKFYRVSGASTQFKGVGSDIVLPDALSYLPDIGEMSLDNPLPWDTNSSVPYDKLNLVQPYLAQLRLRSSARVLTNEDFNYVRQDIAELQRLESDKTSPLNEQEALKERQRNIAKDRARDAERVMRKMSGVKVYDIAVENCLSNTLPLPTPLVITNDSVQILKTFENGSVFGMTTNQALVTGWRADPADTNMTSARILTKSQPVDYTLDEALRIMEDYISLSSTSPSNRDLIANHP